MSRGGRLRKPFSFGFLAATVAVTGSLIGPNAASAQETLGATCPGPRVSYATGIVNAQFAQTFSPSLNGGLTRAEIDFQEQPGQTGGYMVRILAVDGTGTPTNTVVSETTAPELPEGAVTLNARFASPADVVAGQAYALALTRPGGQVSWGYRNDPSACPGSAFYRTGGAQPWGAVGLGIHDLVFSVFVTPPAAQGAPGAQPPTCRGTRATIVGTPGNDVRTGTPGRDVMVGLGGNDTLSGLAGNDLICGGKGNDALNGGRGNDFLSGQKGNDKLAGQKGNDKLAGKKGKDVCLGGPGRDKAKGCEKTRSI